MPNARVVNAPAALASGGLPSNLTVADIMAIIQANAAANATATANKGWQPPAGSDRNQQSFAGAPKWVKGAQYWKPGSKPMDEQ